jgi:hypothetical protein
MPEEVTYTPVPCMCSGIVTSKIEDRETFEVSIYSSPIGEFSGPVFAKEIFQSGQDGNMKQGDYVKVMITFSFGGVENKFVDVFPNAQNFIIGRFNEQTVSKVDVEPSLSANDSERVRFLNQKSGAGIISTDIGKVIISTGGSVYSVGDPFGYGLSENVWKTMAQNHHRIISHNGPFYTAREHFGMFSGSDDVDRLLRLTPEDYLITYRRFVTQTQAPDNWVSTCEGTFDPFMGPNNNSQVVEVGRETLLSKIINHGDSRATIEVGEPGEDFINVRIDDVNISEKAMPSGNKATPGILGNRFKLRISDKGALDIRAGGQGIPGANINKFHMKITEDGELIVHASKGIEFSHGDSDGGINSIKMDPNKGVDITAKNGFRVNGKPVVFKDFLDWMVENQTNLCLTGPPGGPSPINPIALPKFLKGTNIPGDFQSNDVGIPATKLIKDVDDFSSV